MAELHDSLDGLEILGVWANLPDISTYFEIFDDYLDFKIYPWDSTGYDDGEMIPERKNALRLLLTAMQEYSMAHNPNQQQPQQQGGQQPQNLDPNIFDKVVESKAVQQKGNKIVETSTREVVMRAPQKEDLEDWNWKRFAYPDDIKAYEKLRKEGRV